MRRVRVGVVSAVALIAAAQLGGSRSEATGALTDAAGSARVALVGSPTPSWRLFSVAGSGPRRAEGSLANSFRLSDARGVTATTDGGYLIADGTRVIKVLPSGVVAFAAGTGERGYGGDGGPARAAQLAGASDVAVEADGSLLIADTFNDRVRRVAPTGVTSTVAGNGQSGDSGDGIPATAAELGSPTSVAVTADGGFLIADQVNHRIRRVSPAGMISTVAGGKDGVLGGYSGDGGPAIRAALDRPHDVAVTPDRGFLIADTGNDVIRRVDAAGVMTTVAGRRDPVRSDGDGGPARRASIPSPVGVEATPDGGYLIAGPEDYRGPGRVRWVNPRGVISTLAGADDAAPFGGDGLRGPRAGLAHAVRVSRTVDGRVLFAGVDRVRVLSPLPDPHLAVAVGPGTRASRHSIVIGFVATRDAQVRVALGDASVVSSAHSGRNTVRINPRLRAGTLHRIRLAAKEPGGDVVTDSGHLITGGLMTTRRAARYAVRLGYDFTTDVQAEVSPGRCHRFSRRRVDCRMYLSDDFDTICDLIAAILVGADGQPYWRTYDGCRFRSKPRWDPKQAFLPD